MDSVGAETRLGLTSPLRSLPRKARPGRRRDPAPRPTRRRGGCIPSRPAANGRLHFVWELLLRLRRRRQNAIQS